MTNGITANQLKQLVDLVETNVDKNKADVARSVLSEVVKGR
jgi:hypothetical protein